MSEFTADSALARFKELGCTQVFIKKLSTAVLLLNGQTLLASQATGLKAKNRILRFAVASDTHFGQSQTPYQEYLDTAVGHMSDMHKLNPFDFGSS